jgi:hypothetical protein
MKSAFYFCALILHIAILPAPCQTAGPQIDLLLSKQGAKNIPLATPDSFVYLEQATLSSFDIILSSLAHQSGKVIVAEGSPYQSILTEKELKHLSELLLPPAKLSFSEALNKVAQAYDYAIVNNNDKSNTETTIVLHKRYTNPDDFPFVSFDEATRALHDIARGVDILNPKVPSTGPESPQIKLMMSLNEQQLKSAGSGAGLAVSSLTSGQKKNVKDWEAQTRFESNLLTASKIMNLLKTTQNPRSIYRRMDLMGTGISVFGFEGPFGIRKGILQYGLSHNIHAYVIDGTNRIAPPNGGRGVVSSWITGVPSANSLSTMSSIDERMTGLTRAVIQKVIAGNKLPDPSAPTQEDYNFVPKPVIKASKTLAQAVEQLNTVSQTAISVDPIVAEKPVCIFGDINSSNSQSVLQALADTYGLRLEQLQDHSTRLTLPLMPSIQTYSDIPKAMKAVFPSPWRRLFVGRLLYDQMKIAENEASDRKLQAKGDTNQNIAAQRFRKTQIALETRTQTNQERQKALVHRLRVLVEPQLDKAANRLVPMANTSEEAKRLLALLYITDQLENFAAWMTAKPGSRQLQEAINPDNCYIKGSIQYDKNTIRLTLIPGSGDGKNLPFASIIMQDPAIVHTLHP